MNFTEELPIEKHLLLRRLLINIKEFSKVAKKCKKDELKEYRNLKNADKKNDFYVGKPVSCEIENIPVNIDLEYGYYDPRRNVAYLTSGRFESLRWVQIRGEFFDGARSFQGQYIQSVYGPIHNLSFNRSQGESHAN